MNDRERALAAEFSRARGAFVEKGVQPTAGALDAGHFKTAETLMLVQVNPLFEPADAAAQVLSWIPSAKPWPGSRT